MSDLPKYRRDKNARGGGRFVRVKEPVSFEGAVRRLQEGYAAMPELNRRYGWNLSTCAAFIWPDHDMSAQGAAFAASRILKRARDEGYAFWVVGDRTGMKWAMMPPGERRESK